jgi:hypothetical protein
LGELLKAVEPDQEITKERLYGLVGGRPVCFGVCIEDCGECALLQLGFCVAPLQMALAQQGRIRVRPGEIEKMLALHDKYDVR